MTDQVENTKLSSSFVEGYEWRQRKILAFVYSFIFGILVSSFTKIPPIVAVFILIIALGILLSFIVYYKTHYPDILLFSLVIISFSLGIIRYDIKDFYIPNILFEDSEGEKISIYGTVVSEKEDRETYSRVVVDTGREKVLVKFDSLQRISYGDEVYIKGIVDKPGLIDDGIGKSFNYKEYLAKDGIYYILNYSEIEIISRGNGSIIKTWLFKVKNKFVVQVQKILPEPHSSLLSGLVVAGKDSMPKSLLEEFKRAGIVHIVVLSGYNIVIIAEFIKKLLETVIVRSKKIYKLVKGRWIPRLSAIISILFIFLFVLMTGAEATVVRAGIMVAVVILGSLFGKNYSAYRALLGTAFVMVLINPKILVFDPSFQLSFLATIALVYVSPVVEVFISVVPKAFGARSMIATTVGTQILVLPFLVYSMGEISLVSLPANLLVLLFIPTAMFFGFVSVLVSFLSTVVASPFSFISYIILSWIFWVSKILGNFRFASIQTNNTPFWSVVLVYLIIVFILWRLRNFLRKTSS